MAITKASSNAVAAAAKGDLVVGSATNDAAVLGVGSNDQVLTADSSTATGLKWATASAGSLTLLSTTSLTGSSVSVSSISQSYRNLFFVFRNVYLSADNRPLYMTASTASLYGTHMFFSVDGSTLGVESARDAQFMTLARKVGSASGSSYLASGSFTITNYATTATKTVFGNSIAVSSESARSGGTLAGSFYTASALNEITLYVVGGDTFSGGQLLIYGVN